MNDCPDSAFVEDTALILPEAAILLPLGAESRKPESQLIAEPIRTFFGETLRIGPPASIDGGDVLRIGKRLFVGVTSRTNQDGVRALSDATSKWGYEVIPVPVGGSLHLKTAVTSLDDRTILVNQEWCDAGVFEGYRIIDVDPKEPFAANVLRLGDKVIAHAGFERTIRSLRSDGYEVLTVDISEFLKAEAGLTCLSLLTP